MTKRALWILALLALVLTAASCGGSDEEGEGTGTGTTEKAQDNDERTSQLSNHRRRIRRASHEATRSGASSTIADG